MHFVKKLTTLVALLLLVSVNVCRADFFESLGDYVVLAKQVLADQSLPDLQNGVMNISDTTLNKMLLLTVGGDSANSVSSIDVQFQDNNKLSTTIKIKQGDSYQVDAQITQFIHNKTQSQATLKVDKMQILGGGFCNGMKNILLNMCSVQTLANWYGVPKFENGMQLSVNDNTVIVNFHEWLYKTNLGSFTILGKRVLDIINVQKVETTNHNMKVFVVLAN